MPFNNKVCVITGGANGIGRCTTENFLSQGAFVAVIDTDAKAGKRLEKKYGGKFLFMRGDTADEATLEKFAKTVLKKHKYIDFLINNACISKKGILSNCSYKDFNYVLRIGVSAAYLLAKLFKNKFSKGASIINISSTRTHMSQKDTESYTAAKGAISALTHALSVSLAGKARVNCICPGWIDTGAYHNNDNYKPKYSVADKKQHPAGRVGVPQDIAEAILFLCSPKAGFITGQSLSIDGGMTKLMIYHNDNGWTYNSAKDTEYSYF